MTLSTSGLGYRIGSTQIIDGIDIAVASGQVAGVLGPNGAGKSTLLHLISGTMRPSSGGIRLRDEDLLALNRRARAKRVALVEQDVTTELSLKVLDVALLGRTPHRSVFAPDTDDDRRIAIESLQHVGMSEFINRNFDSLSGGERQRVQLSRALVQNPRLLLLDEPTNHLDIHAQLNVLALVRQLAASGVTAIAALHDLNLAATFCDHLIVMSGGRIVAQGAPREILTVELIRNVYDVGAEILTHPTTGQPVITYV